ncbi:phosphodiester glycosidase family protein [Alphaproteobacteria bacterium KMM 3653]|uniref:Phosphodiester glycosidase family protein n=1 Tax=Harenicola maris TaxID=2841044 RepID=A0AAP2CRM8_9RHOB|nr:phosphodiester glycosidase family protein [Harenicola maris]
MQIKAALLAAATWAATTAATLLAAGPAAASCAEVEFDGADYTVCRYSAEQDIRLFHADRTGAVYGSFRAVDAALAEQGLRLDFAMNGGMYHSDRSPVGLYLERGKLTAGLVTRAGPGNFGLLPNGVFCMSPGRAAVIESRAFERENPSCTFASQSGPMLVINGALHPRFLEDSDSRYIRNGVGVSPDGRTVYFAISDERVNFHAFGRLFRDHLGTPNALYFDGKVSRLFAPGLGRADSGFALGPIVGVVVPQ